LTLKVSVAPSRANGSRIVLDGRLDGAGTQAAEAEFNATVTSATQVIVDLPQDLSLASDASRPRMAALKLI